MHVATATGEVYLVSQLRTLDPITVLLQEFGGGKGRIVLECYGLAWTTYFGAMGSETLREFVTTCSADYLANRMWPAKQRRTKADYGYLLRIVEAVQEALKLPMCRNCDTFLPQGCGGNFKAQGEYCLLNRTGLETKALHHMKPSEEAVFSKVLKTHAIDSGTLLCDDCPPASYPTDKTRCTECPRRSQNR
jgi:hypothetical protein